MVTKYKIAVNGTKQPATTSNNQIIQQIAQNTANQQLQNQAQAKAEAIDPMRQTVNDLLKNKLLNNIEVPRFTTVQDILDAPKGTKLETFGKYIGNNPDVTRLVGTLFGGTMRDSSGNFVSAAEPIARRQEALMQAEQQKALSQLKEQNDIATALNQAFNQRDIADENNKRMRELAEMQNEWQKERFAQEMALRQQQLNAQIQHQRAMEGLARERLNNSGGGGVTGGAAGFGKPLSDSQVKEIEANQGNIDNLTEIENRYKDKKYASAFGQKGQLRATLAQDHPIAYAPFDNEITLVRQDLDMLRQRYGKAMEGGRMSDADRAFYRNVLMAQNLSYKNFLEGVKRLKEHEQKQLERKLRNYSLQGKNTMGYSDGYLNKNSQPLTVGGYTIEVE